jgi:flavin reductase (DIM6/NTAB) family NADH-FMN oxidoreductase RutF
MTGPVEPDRFRQVMGEYPTGVVIITAADADGSPLGMTVGSFTSVSLDPCMVAFLPDQNSRSWQALRASGHRFGVNVLAADQEWICRQVAVRKQDKFGGIAWRPSPEGNPMIEGCVAFLDCETEAIHDAGDHHIVVGAVRTAAALRPSNSLLFFQGGYGSFRPRSLAAGAVGLHEQLRYVDVGRDIMDGLASRTGCEVTALTLADGELVTAANSGSKGQRPSRIGQRVPFTPPVGAVHAAWGDDRTRDYWLASMPPSAGEDRREHYLHMLEQIRQRGYGFTVGHAVGTAIEEASIRHSHGDDRISEEEFRRVIHAADGSYNPQELDEDGEFEFHAATVPVFHPGGSIAFTLTLWGPDGTISHLAMRDLIDRLTEAGEAATHAVAAADAHA